MEEIVITLNDGTEVELRECWDCDSCTSSIEVIDCETNNLICTLECRSLPDFEDEDFDMDEFIDKLSDELFGTYI